MWDGQKVRKQDTKVLKEVQCSCSPECQHIGGKRRKWQENMGEMKAEKISMVQIQEGILKQVKVLTLLKGQWRATKGFYQDKARIRCIICTVKCMYKQPVLEK